MPCLRINDRRTGVAFEQASHSKGNTMKIEEFKRELRSSLVNICVEKKWSFDNAKQRGMAFED